VPATTTTHPNHRATPAPPPPARCLSRPKEPSPQAAASGNRNRRDALARLESCIMPGCGCCRWQLRVSSHRTDHVVGPWL